MRTRIIVGAALMALVGGLLWLDWHLEQAGWPAVRSDPAGPARTVRGLPVALLVLVLTAMAYLELAAMSAGAGVAVFRFSGMLSAMMVGTLPFWRQGLRSGGGELLPLVVLGGVLMVLFANQMLRHRTQDAIRRIGVTLLGVCYLGVCGAVVLGIRMRFGLKALVLFALAVKFADIGAYFVGTALGRRRLIPWLSPKKSWEGLLGGLAVAAIAAAVFAAVVNPVFGSADNANMPLAAAAVFGAVVGLFGQGADLCESVLKRDAKLKDAGQALPGLGGVLDVLDSPLLAAPAGYAIFSLLRWASS